MYAQLLKEILFEIEYDQQSVKDVADYCCEQYNNNHIILQNIGKFEREYHLKSPIWWYTYEFFLYTMLNRALRIQEIDTTIDIRLFVRDLHRNIEQLHLIQSNNYQGQSFIVYRGQAMLNIDFTKMKNSLGSLLSFNDSFCFS
jgi:hydroxymethylpyrimidine pyrophosphatase-like HAD family hydrolase